MTGYEIPNLRFSLPAGGAVARGRFVACDANGAGIQSTAATLPIGASMNEVTEGQVLEIADGIVMVMAAAEIVAGTEVSSDADGKVITTVAGPVAGIAVTGGAAGVYIAVKIK